MFNIQGRFHHRRKSLSAEIRGDIIDSVLEAGGESTNGYFPLKHGRSNCQTYGCCGSALEDFRVEGGSPL